MNRSCFSIKQRGDFFYCLGLGKSYNFHLIWLAKKVSDFFKKCLLRCFSTIKSPNGGQWRNSKMSGKLINAAGFVPNSISAIIASVGSLLKRRGPSAIGWAVITVIINTIKGLSFWSLPHISKKILKFFPAFTYRNSSPSVSMEKWIVFVKASRPHASPRNKCSSIGHAMCFVHQWSKHIFGIKSNTIQWV